MERKTQTHASHWIRLSLKCVGLTLLSVGVMRCGPLVPSISKHIPDHQNSGALESPTGELLAGYYSPEQIVVLNTETQIVGLDDWKRSSADFENTDPSQPEESALSHIVHLSEDDVRTLKETGRIGLPASVLPNLRKFNSVEMVVVMDASSSVLRSHHQEWRELLELRMDPLEESDQSNSADLPLSERRILDLTFTTSLDKEKPRGQTSRNRMESVRSQVTKVTLIFSRAAPLE